MSYLVDTCLLSELRKPQPAPAVVAWVERMPAHLLFLSVLTLGEIRKGVTKLPPSARRDRFERWLEIELPRHFFNRILPIDEKVALAWGQLHGEAELRGRPSPVVDTLLAATARVHGLTLVTRNLEDFRPFGLPLLDPWRT